MFDEENFDESRPLRAPRLSSELQASRFVVYEGLEYLRYPGGPIFERLESAVADYVEVRNPRDQRARMPMLIGAPTKGQAAIQAFQTRCEKRLIPEERRCSEALMAAMFARPVSLRPGYERVMVELAPGATERIPMHWLSAWRTVKDGQVIAGMFPQVEVIGEEDPPMLHHCFADAMPAGPTINPDRYKRAQP